MPIQVTPTLPPCCWLGACRGIDPPPNPPRWPNNPATYPSANSRSETPGEGNVQIVKKSPPLPVDYAQQFTYFGSSCASSSNHGGHR